MVESQIQTLLETGVSEIVVVLGYKAEEVASYIAEKESVRVVINPGYESGRASSIRAGLDAVSPDASDILIMAVDQPRSPQIISKTINSHIEEDAPLTSPRYRGRGGHPLIFSASLLPELSQISEENQGLREVFERHRSEINEVIFDDPAIRLDLNTPQAYRDAFELYGREQGRAMPITSLTTTHDAMRLRPASGKNAPMTCRVMPSESS